MDELTYSQIDAMAKALAEIGTILSKLETPEQRIRLVRALVILFEAS